jgi:hypothetical protein
MEEGSKRGRDEQINLGKEGKMWHGPRKLRKFPWPGLE